MTTKTRPRFNPEFKVECAQLVLDQRYSIREEADGMNVVHSIHPPLINGLEN